MRKGIIALIILIVLGLLYIIDAISYKGNTLIINFIPNLNMINISNIYFDMFFIMIIIIAYLYFTYRDDV
jgi:hypothetical protein